MNDTLNWIPTKDSSFTKRKIQMGLDHYAITIIDKESGPVLKNILNGWRTIFACAPKSIELTGSYYTIEGEDWEGEYEKLVFEKEEIIEQLDTFLSFIDKIEKGGYKIYHFGI